MSAWPLLQDRYLVVEQIGEGDLGVVYRGHDHQLDRDVAIKVLRPQYADEAAAAGRVLEAAERASRLSHPNICGVLDSGLDDGHLFVVMDLVEGQTLADVIAAHGRVGARQALRITELVAGALQSAHDHGIVHGDLSPSKILLAPSGELRVVDFGLDVAARSVSGGEIDEEARADDDAAAGEDAARASYASPEVVGGAEPTPPSDIYALGLVLYELVTGKAPFSGGTDVHDRIRRGPPPPTFFAQDLPARIDALIARAIARTPARRYASASEMRTAALAEIAALDAEPAGDGDEERASAPVAAAGIAAAVAGIGAAIARGGGTDQSASETAAASRSAASRSAASRSAASAPGREVPTPRATEGAASAATAAPRTTPDRTSAEPRNAWAAPLPGPAPLGASVEDPRASVLPATSTDGAPVRRDVGPTAIGAAAVGAPSADAATAAAGLTASAGRTRVAAMTSATSPGIHAAETAAAAGMSPRGTARTPSIPAARAAGAMAATPATGAGASAASRAAAAARPVTPVTPMTPATSSGAAGASPRLGETQPYSFAPQALPVEPARVSPRTTTGPIVGARDVPRRRNRLGLLVPLAALLLVLVAAVGLRVIGVPPLTGGVLGETSAPTATSASDSPSTSAAAVVVASDAPSISPSFATPSGTGFGSPSFEPAPGTSATSATFPSPVPTPTPSPAVARAPTVAPTQVRPTLPPLVPVPTLRPAPRPIVAPTPQATPRPTPQATPRPTPRATPRPTPHPTPLPTPRPTATPAPVAVSNGRPTDAVFSFYSLVARHQFDAAARLWSDAMKRRYPPAEYLNGRFARTTSIVINRLMLVSQKGPRATVAVDITETLSDGNRARYVGSWNLVRTGNGWLLDRPRF